ncbi:MAG: nitric oxide reductase activation protein NorD [Desulfobacterales bacterium]
MTSPPAFEDPWSELIRFDPDTAKKLDSAFRRGAGEPPPAERARIAETILWSFSQELHFGGAVAAGYVDLGAAAGPDMLARYGEHVRRFGSHGPALGRTVAELLVPLLKTYSPLLESGFFETLDILLAKGTYLLKEPLSALEHLLPLQDRGIALDYLRLIGEVFSLPLSYNQCLHLAHQLPRALKALPIPRLPDHLRELRRLVLADIAFLEPYLEGTAKGLSLLDGKALDRFVGMAIEKADVSAQTARRFLSLSSATARNVCAGLQTAATVAEIQGRLNRYLSARTGIRVTVRPLSDLPDSRRTPGPCTDGRVIYLPDEVRVFPSRAENIRLVQSLARIESGTLEFGTFAFDLDRTGEYCRQTGLPFEATTDPSRSDLEILFRCFPCPSLAEDLFTVFEHGRIRRHFEAHYPGLAKKAYIRIVAEARKIYTRLSSPENLLSHLYLVIGLGEKTTDSLRRGSVPDLVRRIGGRFESQTPEKMPVEASGWLTVATYADVERRIGVLSPGRYAPMDIPFGRRFRPDLFFTTHNDLYRRVDSLRERLRARGIDLYRTDLIRHMIENAGRLTVDALHRSLKSGSDGTLDALPAGDALALPHEASDADETPDEDPSTIRWVKEWDRAMGDYLQNHVRIRDRFPEGRDGGGYQEILDRHAGLVNDIRYAFELLKPEGLKRLRRWVEGDDFDYRELVDHILDRRAGLQPSERLYIKRIKQVREVSVLLLVDLSRSTSNLVNGEGLSVLDVEKEAIVLFSQALEVVGDAYAIAGFSGTGRLGVDYFRIKDFDDPMSDDVRNRICAITPQRSTRMGAAVRRASQQLEAAGTRVRLLILLSDGFPNDTDYKQDYALEDTRMAIAEARAQGITTHAITVNLPGHSRLDALYGNVGHTVISEVRELPDSLLRLYSRLTRN